MSSNLPPPPPRQPPPRDEIERLVVELQARPGVMAVDVFFGQRGAFAITVRTPARAVMWDFHPLYGKYGVEPGDGEAGWDLNYRHVFDTLAGSYGKVLELIDEPG